MAGIPLKPSDMRGPLRVQQIPLQILNGPLRAPSIGGCLRAANPLGDIALKGGGRWVGTGDETVSWGLEGCHEKEKVEGEVWMDSLTDVKPFGDQNDLPPLCSTQAARPVPLRPHLPPP